MNGAGGPGHPGGSDGLGGGSGASGSSGSVGTATSPRAPVTHLLYLHGFRSSPRSTKARWTAGWLAAHRPDVTWCCPQLPASPRQAMAQVEDLTRGWPQATSAVIGSSLGGFYADACSGRTGWRCVVANPAVDPARDLARYIGEHRAWHSDERIHFEPGYIDELDAIAAAAPADPARVLAVIAKGDEVLDWREMAQRHRGARTILIDGDSHALTSWPQRWPQVADFLGWGPGGAGTPPR